MNLDFSSLFGDSGLASFYEAKEIETEPTEQYKSLLTGEFLTHFFPALLDLI